MVQTRTVKSKTVNGTRVKLSKVTSTPKIGFMGLQEGDYFVSVEGNRIPGPSKMEAEEIYDGEIDRLSNQFGAKDPLNPGF